jgi:hypothetical protein
MPAQTVLSFTDADELSFNITNVEIGGAALRLKDLGGGTYSTGDDTVVMAHQLQATALGTFAESATKPANTEIKYTLLINSSPYWYNTVTATWEAATYGLYAESNTATEINTNLATLLSTLSIASAFYFGLRIHLHSTGSARPELASVTVGAYVFDYPSPTTISECLVTCYLSDLLGADYAYDATKPARLIVKNSRAFHHGSKLIQALTKSALFDSNGRAQLSVIETETPEEYVEFQVTYYEGEYLKTIRYQKAIVPNQPAANLNNITTPERLDF